MLKNPTIPLKTAIVYVPAAMSGHQVMTTLRNYPSLRLGRMKPGRICTKLIIRGTDNDLYNVVGDLP